MKKRKKRTKDNILRDQLSTSKSADYTKDEREHALRCLLYEMLILALALVQLKNKGEKLRDHVCGKELPFGEEQTAHEAASLTCRLLIEFLYPKVMKGEDEDTSTPKNLRKLHKSLHKWAAHLTWERVWKHVKKENKYPQTYPEVLLEDGPKVLDEAAKFVDDCINKYGYELKSPNAEPYYHKFQELKTQLTDL